MVQGDIFAFQTANENALIETRQQPKSMPNDQLMPVF
jgi:hypothetical protein